MTVSVEQRIATARLRKAHRLVSALRAAGATVSMFDELGDDFPWNAAVEAAGVRPPSDETKALVREAMEFLEERDRHGIDPFGGLV